MIRLTEEEILEARLRGGGYSVTIDKDTTLENMAVAQAQLKKVAKKARNGCVIDSKGEISLHNSIHHYFWQALLKECEE